MWQFTSDIIHHWFDPMTYWLLSPIVLAIGLGLLSLLFEDIALLLGIALLHHDSTLAYYIFSGLFLGILLGDFSLYIAGRWLKNMPFVTQMLMKPKMQRVSTKIGQHIIPMLIICRAIPASRLPTFLTAGVLKTPFKIFALIIVPSVLLWVTLILFAGFNLTHFVEETLHISSFWLLLPFLMIALSLPYLKRLRLSA